MISILPASDPLCDFTMLWGLAPSPQASQVALVVKNPLANAGDARDTGSIPGWERSPGRRHGNPLQYSCLENPHGWRSLAGYSPWGCRELDTTEQLSMHVIQFGVLPHSILMLHVFSQEVFFVLISQIVSMFMV